MNETKKSLVKFKGKACKVHVKMDSDAPIEVIELTYTDYAHPNYIFISKLGGSLVQIQSRLILKMEEIK